MGQSLAAVSLALCMQTRRWAHLLALEFFERFCCSLNIHPLIASEPAGNNFAPARLAEPPTMMIIIETAGWISASVRAHSDGAETLAAPPGHCAVAACWTKLKILPGLQNVWTIFCVITQLFYARFVCDKKYLIWSKITWFLQNVSLFCRELYLKYYGVENTYEFDKSAILPQ